MFICTVSPSDEMFPEKWIGANSSLKGSGGLAQGVFSRFQILKLDPNQCWTRSANGMKPQWALLGFELNPQKWG